MDTFTLITGLASLIGFAIQVFDLFPKIGRVRQTVSLLLVGVFIGSFLRAIDPSSVKLNFQFTGFAIIVALFATVIVGFLMAAAFSSDIAKRSEFYGVAGIGFLVFIIVLFFGGLISGSVDNPSMEKQRISISELNILADQAIQNKDFERALMHMHTIESRINGTDPRLKTIKEKIQRIQLLELK